MRAAGEAQRPVLRDVGARVDEEAGVPVPHHGFEVALELLATGVVAAGLVLAVVLRVAEDRRGCGPVRGFDEGQFGLDLVRGPRPDAVFAPLSSEPATEKKAMLRRASSLMTGSVAVFHWSEADAYRASVMTTAWS